MDVIRRHRFTEEYRDILFSKIFPPAIEGLRTRLDERDTPLSRQFIDIPLRQKTAMLNVLTRPMAARHVHVAGGTNAHHRVVLTCHGGTGSPFGACCRQPWVGPKLKCCRVICLN